MIDVKVYDDGKIRMVVFPDSEAEKAFCNRLYDLSLNKQLYLLQQSLCGSHIQVLTGAGIDCALPIDNVSDQESIGLLLGGVVACAQLYSTNLSDGCVVSRW